jgi:micrococcal nuclease
MITLLICLAPIAVDGDTIRCPDKTSIRLYGVNSVDGTPLDTEAKNVLAGLITGGLICEPKGTSYSRIVAVCRNGSGADIGKALIDNHLASEWCSYSRNFYGTCP